MFMYGDLEMIDKELVLPSFNLLSRHSEGNSKNPARTSSLSAQM
jgi:hypothetical protein